MSSASVLSKPRVLSSSTTCTPVSVRDLVYAGPRCCEGSHLQILVRRHSMASSHRLLRRNGEKRLAHAACEAANAVRIQEYRGEGRPVRGEATSQVGFDSRNLYHVTRLASVCSIIMAKPDLGYIFMHSHARLPTSGVNLYFDCASMALKAPYSARAPLASCVLHSQSPRTPFRSVF